MCSLKKAFIIGANFSLCCLSLAGIGLLVYRSHEEDLLSAEAVKNQKLNLPLAQGCVLLVVIVAACLGILGLVKRASGLLIVNAVLLQLLLMAETALCGYYAGDQNGANIFVKKLAEVLPVGQRQTSTVDIDFESKSSMSLIVIVALQIIVQEVIIIWTWFIALQLRYYVGEIPDFRSKSYTKVKS